MADLEANLLDSLSAEPPASPSHGQDLELAWLIRAATWHLNIWRWLSDSDVSGWYGRTFPAFYQAGQMRRQVRKEADGRVTILTPSSVDFRNSGTGGRGECLTLSTSEFTGWNSPSPSDDVVCSLSDILETGDHLLPYFLSATACRGILRRAEKRGKDLPPALKAALVQVAEHGRALRKLRARSEAVRAPNRGRPIQTA